MQFINSTRCIGSCYQILLIILMKEFVNLNVNTGTITIMNIVKAADCDYFLEYTNFKDNFIERKCFSDNKKYQNRFDENCKNSFSKLSNL